MKAYLHSVRIAPKKANLIARMVRGMNVHEAIASLERTHKKGARIVEILLKSAVANAVHNDKQDPSALVITSIVVNQGTALRRGIPKARGQVRPIRKFMSHIRVELGVAKGEGSPDEKTQKTQKTQKTHPTSSADSGLRGARKTQKTQKTQKKAKKSNSQPQPQPQP